MLHEKRPPRTQRLFCQRLTVPQRATFFWSCSTLTSSSPTSETNDKEQHFGWKFVSQAGDLQQSWLLYVIHKTCAAPPWKEKCLQTLFLVVVFSEMGNCSCVSHCSKTLSVCNGLSLCLLVVSVSVICAVTQKPDPEDSPHGHMVSMCLLNMLLIIEHWHTCSFEKQADVFIFQTYSVFQNCRILAVFSELIYPSVKLRTEQQGLSRVIDQHGASDSMFGESHNIYKTQAWLRK